MKKIGVFFCFLIIGCKEVHEYKPTTKPITQITYSSCINIFPHLFTERYLLFSSNISSNFDIYIKDLKENSVVQRTRTKEDELFPSFSPDGEKIVFSSKRFGSFDIFIIPSFRGGNIEQVTFDNDYDEISANFSPDGNSLAFCKVKEEKGIICLLNLKNKMITELTEGFSPNFSPKGDKIVFERDGKIYIYELKTHLSKEIVQYEGLSCSSPSFSPDGKMIVYVVSDKKGIDIRVIDIDGTSDIKLTEDRGPDGFPFWSADNYIYFSSSRNAKDNCINIFRLNFSE